MAKERSRILAILALWCFITLIGTAIVVKSPISSELGIIIFAIGILFAGSTVIKIGKQDSLIFGNPKEDTPEHLADKKWTARFYYISGVVMVTTAFAMTGIIVSVFTAPGLALLTLGIAKRVVQRCVVIHTTYQLKLFEKFIQMNE